MTVKERIADLIANKRRFSVMTNMYMILDALVYDIDTDPDAIIVLCKFNTSALTKNEPTFGSPIANTGLQEIYIPYNQITGISIFDVDQKLLDDFKTKYPHLYDVYSNGNKVEGVIIPSKIPVEKSKMVKEWEEKIDGVMV